ncbi:hypothetical protein FQN57_003444 [Myotisia sp. PD_48]|nr:hypothetical protein FQN57_003444 [Myotisia sp. PD_48]
MARQDGGYRRPNDEAGPAATDRHVPYDTDEGFGAFRLSDGRANVDPQWTQRTRPVETPRGRNCEPARAREFDRRRDFDQVWKLDGRAGEVGSVSAPMKGLSTSVRTRPSQEKGGRCSEAGRGQVNVPFRLSSHFSYLFLHILSGVRCPRWGNVWPLPSLASDRPHNVSRVPVKLGITPRIKWSFFRPT